MVTRIKLGDYILQAHLHYVSVRYVWLPKGLNYTHVVKMETTTHLIDMPVSKVAVYPQGTSLFVHNNVLCSDTIYLSSVDRIISVRSKLSFSRTA